ncbi:hypothetical protein PV10_02626 [Exophiala mesophila]|uniref:Exonuclease V, mitochondrial n=1 Tax=Exophiala mesophila TaxID=212818 RepID=A0A0D1WZE8_EXOME|nr:uncharacterized protein PV10_02626 [Exophiala mesophila]KIV94905.1 hypothetical protein PV10_02626 [Exophiala mesophila]
MTPTTPPSLLQSLPNVPRLLSQQYAADFHMQVDSTGSQTHLTPIPSDDEYSEFGADPEELELIEHLLQEAARTPPITHQNPSLVVIDIEDYEAPRGVHLPKVPSLEATQQWNLQSQFANREPPEARATEAMRNQDPEARPPSADEDVTKPDADDIAAVSPPIDASDPVPPDTRPPIERFRKPPKKALSVTDLVSPAWCELQYFYVLSKHGRKRRTPAMKQGSKVHKVLEEEVHVTVPVTITKKEDSWGLRIWNIIQGLRTLRETGKTREFEVWGTVGGELVNGIIDELSYNCPDPKLEEQSLSMLSKSEVQPPVPEYQATIRDYLISSTHSAQGQGQSITDALTGKNIKTETPSNGLGTYKSDRRIYISDVKTRGVLSLPTGSSIRPTIVQLHIYHYMLENMAQGNFTLDVLSDRYNFDVNEPFSDEFIAQIGNLNQGPFDLGLSQEPSNDDDEMEIDDKDEIVPSTQDTIDILLQNNNVTSLWNLMLDQLRQTFIVSSSPRPNDTHQGHDITSSTADNETLGPTSTPSLSQTLTLTSLPPLPTRLSPVLTANYISSHVTDPSDPSKPRVIGSKSIIFNPSFLKNYLYDALAFWRGERQPKGVTLSETWKCRVCEFRDGCEWLKEQDDRVLQESLERKRLRNEADEAQGGNGDEVRRSRV